MKLNVLLAVTRKLADDAFTCTLQRGSLGTPVVIYTATRSTRSRALDAALAGAGYVADIDYVEHDTDGTTQHVYLCNVLNAPQVHS